MVDEGIRTLLLAELERTRARAARLQAEIETLTRARRSESDDDEHDPEGVTLSSQWSMLAGLLDAARAEERQAEAAMHRLDAGEYGVCSTCLNPIPGGQLEARPFREQCVACADRRRR